MNLGDNLKSIRKEHNLSQEQFAEALGVSRQSVSKWESGLAYPEMDKVLAICKMFNLNIDELMNQNYKEISETKQSSNTINKYIDDFLAYVTKTVDMFSAMKFKSKIKCLSELAFIIFILFMMSLIAGSIGDTIISDLLSFLPNKVSWFLHSIITDIYIIAALVFGTILVFHIFKTRYLDYYTIIKEDNNKKENELNEANSNNEKETIILEKKKEKIVIRDPKHSNYKFILGLAKCLIFCIKILACFIFLGFCLSLIGFISTLVISFMFTKTGLTFIGVLLILISCIIINIIFLDILFNFIVSKKSKKGLLFLMFILSLITLGIGCGLCAITVPNFDVKTDYSIKEENRYSMNNQLVIESSYHINYIENSSNDLIIKTYHSKYYKTNIKNDNNTILIHNTPNYKGTELFKTTKQDINNKHFIDYSDYKIEVYTSKENIKKLQDNYKKRYEENIYE